MHFLLAAGAAVTAAILVVRAISALRRRRRQRSVALLAAAGAVSLYALGMLLVLGAVLDTEDGGAGGSPLGPCREAGDRIAGQVIGYEVGYLWPSFDCRLSDGGTYPTPTVPKWINPAAVVLGVAALALVATERSSRRMSDRGR